MNKREMYLRQWEMWRKCYAIGSLLDVPMLILLWYLHYYVGFWLALGLIIINSFYVVQIMRELEKKMEKEI